jgi:hypothetical protein
LIRAGRTSSSVSSTHFVKQVGEAEERLKTHCFRGDPVEFGIASRIPADAGTPSLTGLRDAMMKKRTRRELFLAEMDAVVPWGRLLALIAPHCPGAGPKGGRPPMSLEI